MPAIPLPGVKAIKINRMEREVNVYIATHYNDAQQVALNALWIEGVQNPTWATRRSLCQSVVNWKNSVLDHFYTQRDAVNAAATIGDVVAVTLNLRPFDGTDPRVNLRTIRAATV